MRDLIGKLLALAGQPIASAGRIARVLLALIAGLAAVGLALRPVAGPLDLLRRAGLVTLVLVLTTPAQFPWYMIWTLPFLPFAPRWSVMAMAVTLPVYYASFHFSAIDAYNLFRDRVVWAIWIPIWGLLALEAGNYLRRGRPAGINPRSA